MINQCGVTLVFTAFHICDMFMIRKYTHHLMSGKGIRENFERTLFFCRIKKSSSHLWNQCEICISIVKANY